MSKILIFLFFFKFVIPMVVFPFKTAYINKNGQITKDSPEYNVTHFGNDNFDMKLYIDLKIGNPFQKVKIILSSELCGSLKIGKSKYCIESDEYKSYYNRNYSEDFNYTDQYNESDSDFDFNKPGRTAIDTIYAYSDLKLTNELQYEKIGFYLGTDTKDKICGTMGFEKDDLLCSRILNISDYFKTRKYINNYKFMIKYYNTTEEGLYILSGELKDIINDYNETNAFSLKVNAGQSHLWQFTITQTKIENKNGTVETNRNAVFDNDLSLIRGTEAYLNSINDTYFKEYIEKGICSLNLYDADPSSSVHGKYLIYECDKGKFGQSDLEKFPKLYLGVREMGTLYEFVFDYKYLFTETKYKYFFNIIFSRFEYQWYFGKLFLKKYSINFDIKSQMIEIYDNDIIEDIKPIPYENGNDESNYLALYISLIVVLIAIAAVVGYFLGKYINKMRKKRANELLDDYDYKPDSEPKPVLDS